jgi:hypothetical protein
MNERERDVQYSVGGRVFPARRDAFPEVVMKSEGNNDNLRAFVQTAERAGGFVWVITLVDFDAKNVRRSLVSDDTFSTAAAAKDAGDARLAAMSADR